MSPQQSWPVNTPLRILFVSLALIAGLVAVESAQTNGVPRSARQPGAPPSADAAPVEQFAHGYDLLTVGKAAEAIEWFRKGLERDPANPLAHFYLAEAYVATGRTDDARPHFEQVILLAPALREAAWARSRLAMPGAGLAVPAPTHGGHGTPSDWKPAWPAGDVAKGRDTFVKLECYRCHAVGGEKFATSAGNAESGPELSQMGAVHDTAYFIEAVVNPSATIDRGKGYEAADGSSKMPSYNDVLTVQELMDLVAFLRSLRPAGPAAPAGGHERH